MGKENHSDTLTMKERREHGLLWIDTGENVGQQILARGLCQDFNQTRAAESEKRTELWNKLFASCGKNVWIGSNGVIGARVTIGMGAVIGAGSVVTRDIPPMHFAAGVPCKVIREITDDDLKEFEPIP